MVGVSFPQSLERPWIAGGVLISVYVVLQVGITSLLGYDLQPTLGLLVSTLIVFAALVAISYVESD